MMVFMWLLGSFFVYNFFSIMIILLYFASYQPILPCSHEVVFETALTLPQRRIHKSRAFCEWEMSYFETSHGMVVSRRTPPPSPRWQPASPQAGSRMQTRSQRLKQVASLWRGWGFSFLQKGGYLGSFTCIWQNCGGGGESALGQTIKRTIALI